MHRTRLVPLIVIVALSPACAALTPGITWGPDGPRETPPVPRAMRVAVAVAEPEPTYPPLAPPPIETPDRTPPRVQSLPPRNASQGKVAVRFRVVDASELFGVLFHWREVGSTTYRQIDFPTTQSDYTAEFEVTRDFESWIEAYDELGNGPAYDAGPGAPHQVRVAERRPSFAPPDDENENEIVCSGTPD